MSELLTAADVGKLLTCSRPMVYRLRTTGKLIARWKLFDKERGWRWSRADVEEYLQRKTVTEKPVSIPEKVVREIVFTPSVDAPFKPYIRTRDRHAEKSSL